MGHIYKILLREKEKQEWLKIVLPSYFDIGPNGQPIKEDLFKMEVESFLEREWGNLRSARFGKATVVRVAYVGYLI